MSESTPVRSKKKPDDRPGDSAALSAETHAWAQRMGRIMSRAVREAQEESRRLGVPNVYSYGGVIYYEQPDGTLSTEDPYEEDETSEA